MNLLAHPLFLFFFLVPLHNKRCLIFKNLSTLSCGQYPDDPENFLQLEARMRSRKHTPKQETISRTLPRKIYIAIRGFSFLWISLVVCKFGCFIFQGDKMEELFTRQVDREISTAWQRHQHLDTL